MGKHISHINTDRNLIIEYAKLIQTTIRYDELCVIHRPGFLYDIAHAGLGV